MLSFLRAAGPRLSPASMVAGFLVLTVSLAVWLGYQAVDAARSHRLTAEAALRDYARISAWEFSRTARGNLDDVLDEIFDGVVGRRVRAGEFLPTAQAVGSDLRDAVEDEGCRCLRFRSPVALFTYDARTGRVDVTPSSVSDAAVRGLADEILASRPDLRRYGTGFATAPAGRYFEDSVAVGYYLTKDTLSRPQSVLGVVVTADALGELFLGWYDRRSLLPQPIGGDQPNDSLLFVTVRDAEGLTIFESPTPYSTTLSATDTLGIEFGNLIVEASVRPEAASQLIIGGLPKSRLPLLVTLLLLTLGVGAASLVQLRREQAFQALRDDFVSGVSHELRTPLAQIRMFAELQETERLPAPEDRRRAVAVIHRESRRLTHLVDNILQFSRLRRASERILPRERLDVAEALAEGLDAVTPLLQDRGMRLGLEAEAGLVVIANRDALTRIVVNLLDNAIKYGPEGQTISVSVEERDGAARLSVGDEGPGVPQAERTRVWKAYRRLERDVKAQLPGTGIGLSVVAELVSLLGGRAWVEEAAGGGALFVVEVPLAPAGEDSRTGVDSAESDSDEGPRSGVGVPAESAVAAPERV